MRADADEAADRFAAAGMAAAISLMQGITRVLSGDLESGGASFEEALGAEENAGA